MFRGRHVHTIDSKGRVSIPASFRAEMQLRSENDPILTNDAQCLVLYAYEEFAAIEDRLEDASPVDPAVKRYSRFLLSGSVQCGFDSQGRILVPPELRKHAHLDREVMIAGVGTRIEIWDKALFDQEIQQTVANLDEIASAVAAQGT